MTISTEAFRYERVQFLFGFSSQKFSIEATYPGKMSGGCQAQSDNRGAGKPECLATRGLRFAGLQG